MKKIEIFLSSVVALIFLQTLFFKFTGAAESVWIFKTLGLEPVGRYFSGIVELICSILLFRSSTRLYGAILGALTMLGAFFGHVFFFGIVIQNDDGLLFGMCTVSLLACICISYLRRQEISFKAFGLGIFFFLPVIGHSKVSYNMESDYGIHGYDPVSYLTSNVAQEGKKNFKHSYDGVTYLFENQQNLEAFKKSPEKYVPAYGGWCAYAMADGDKVDIDPKTFKVIQSKTYLFYNGIWGNTLTKWDKDENNLKSKADSFWNKISK